MWSQMEVTLNLSPPVKVYANRNLALFSWNRKICSNQFGTKVCVLTWDMAYALVMIYPDKKVHIFACK